MTSLVLNHAARESLERLRSETRDASVFRNATVILLTAEGYSKAELCRVLGCSVSTVDRARRAYHRAGFGGLLPVKPPGRPSRATPAFRAAMAAAVQTPPQTLGYGFNTWGVSRLAAHLKKVT